MSDDAPGNLYGAQNYRWVLRCDVSYSHLQFFVQRACVPNIDVAFLKGDITVFLSFSTLNMFSDDVCSDRHGF